MKAVIIAGGLGKRLHPLTASIPKPMLLLNGKPILENEIEWLKRNGIQEIILCTGYLSEKVESYFGNGSEFGVEITYSVEQSELGTGGALKNAEKLVGKETFIALYADLVVDVDLEKFVKFHREKGGIATLALHPSTHPYDSDMVACNEEGRITAFPGKPKEGQKFVNLGNAGLYCFEPALFKYFPGGKSKLDGEVLPRALAAGEKLYGYSTREKIEDIGTHERYGKHRG